MQIDKLLEQRERISEKMERLGKKEKMLKAKERKIQTKKLIQSGEMVAKAKIEHLPPSALLGALLEIRERAHD